MSERQISFGLVVRNEEHQIGELLDQISLVMGLDLLEILIVDNASTDRTVSIVREWIQHHPGRSVKLIIRDYNHMAEARNQVLSEASSEWVYFTDADCRLGIACGSDLIEKIDFFSKDSSVAAIGGGNKVGGQSHWLERRLFEMSQVWLGHMGSIQIASPKKIQQASLLSTCNILVHRKKALSVGGFDNDFSFVGEDMSLCHRLIDGGFKLMAIPGFDVIHLQRMSLLKWCSKMHCYGIAQVRIASVYMKHFMGLRGLQFTFVWLALGLLLVKPVFLSVLVISYLLFLFAMCLVSLKTFQSAVKATGFIFLSQFFYAAGELVGTVTSLRLFISSHLPSKMPALEQK